MRFGLDVGTTGEFADPRLLADLAAQAESSGWDGFFLWDVVLAGGPDGSPVPVVDPWLSLAPVALATRRIRIGVMVTPLPRRRPWHLARQVTTLDHLSGGRVTVGVGLGNRAEELRCLGEPVDPRERAELLDEGLDLLDAFWSGEEVNFAGRHHRVAGVTLLPGPVQRPRPPVWVAAGWPRRRPVRRAARWDGVYLMTLHQRTRAYLSPQDVQDVVTELGDGAGRVDVALNGYPPRGASLPDHVLELADAGATWWLALCPDTPQEFRALIGQGPPVR